MLKVLIITLCLFGFMFDMDKRFGNNLLSANPVSSAIKEAVASKFDDADKPKNYSRSGSRVVQISPKELKEMKSPAGSKSYETKDAYHLTFEDINYYNSMARKQTIPQTNATRVLKLPSGISLKMQFTRKNLGICPRTKKMNYSISGGLVKSVVPIY